MIFQIQPNPIQQIILVLESWDKFLSGFLLTMWLYMWALLIGFFLGLLLAILRQYGGLIFSSISTGYIEIIRGTPLLAQLLFLYFIPLSLNLDVGGWSIGSSFNLFDKDITIILLNYRTLIAIITLGLNSAAYQAEYIRGSIVSVSNEQLVAAQSLGMSRWEGIRRIVLPQAFRRVIPAWSNEAAYLPKYTVVVYFIGVLEIFAQAYVIAFVTFAVIFTYILVAILFLITITIISKGLDILHKRTAIPGL
ncbi:MAG: amino acid ABC transporter permease [Candidatus Hodarchaeales archaeon]|jgi:polar amino acid transport system permease protein